MKSRAEPSEKRLEKFGRKSIKKFEAWLTKPLLFQDLKWVYEAFKVLCRSRATDGMAPTAIPISEITDYGIKVVGCPPVSLEMREFISLVVALDCVWIADIRSKINKRDNGKHTGTGSRRQSGTPRSTRL